MRIKSIEIANSIYSNLWCSKPKTYTQIAKELGKGANPSTIKKYCMILAGLDNKNKKSEKYPLNWDKKRDHIYYSINYKKYKDAYHKKLYKNLKKESDKLYKKCNVRTSTDFNHLLKKLRKKKIFKD